MCEDKKWRSKGPKISFRSSFSLCVTADRFLCTVQNRQGYRSYSFLDLGEAKRSLCLDAV